MSNYSQLNELQENIQQAEFDLEKIDAQLNMVFYKLIVAREVMAPEDVTRIEIELTELQRTRSLVKRMIGIAKKELVKQQEAAI